MNTYTACQMTEEHPTYPGKWRMYRINDGQYMPIGFCATWRSPEKNKELKERFGLQEDDSTRAYAKLKEEQFDQYYDSEVEACDAYREYERIVNASMYERNTDNWNWGEDGSKILVWSST